VSNPNDFAIIQYRLAEVISIREVFSADDVTLDGRFAIDHAHRPNSRQGMIGRGFNWAVMLGLIAPVDTATRQSRNPRRKRGSVRLWRRTEAGAAWAITFLDEHADYAYCDPQMSLFDEVDL